MNSARKVIVPIVLDLLLLDRVDEVAQRRKISRSEMVREFCREGLKAE